MICKNQAMPQGFSEELSLRENQNHQEKTERKGGGQEKWLPVNGYEGIYHVSSFGRIRSYVNRFRTKRIKERALSVTSRGYLNVRLSIYGKTTNLLVHRVVANEFIGNIPKGFEVNHKDGIKTNNNVVNLEIVTSSFNKIHATKMGLSRSGDRHPSRVLTQDLVNKIRKDHSGGTYSRHQLCSKHNVKLGTLRDVIERKTWITNINTGTELKTN